MPGFDLDRYKDLEGLEPLKRVLATPEVKSVVMRPPEPAPEREKGEPPEIELRMKVIRADPPKEPPKRTGAVPVRTRTHVIEHRRPAPAKPATMSDIKLP